jgi:hypothetical protein
MNPTVERKLEWSADRGHLVLHALLPIVLAGVGAELGAVVAASNPTNCNYQDVNGLPVDYLPDWRLVIVGLLGFVGGRQLSRLSQRREYAPTSHGSDAVGQWAMVCVLAGMTVVWFYEAIGVAHVSASSLGATQFEPITYYIRCAIYHDKAATGVGWWTMFVVFLVCGLAGHWLWSEHPRLRRTRATRARESETTLA